MADGASSNDESDSKRLRGHDWFELRDQVLDRDDHVCRNCGSSTNLVVHHIVPVEASGTNRLSNLATLCRVCHRRAHNERIRDSGGDQSADASRYLLTVDELRQVIRAATHPLERATIMTLTKTGIGVGELCNLDIDDLQLPNSSLRAIPDEVPKQIPLLRVRYGGQLPYNNRRERKETTYIPIDDELALALKRWLLIRPDPHEGNPLFVSTRRQWGKRVSPQVIRNTLESHGKALGLYATNSEMENLTPYSLRYFFEERFAGQPLVRDYLLGRRPNISWSLTEIATHYEQHVFHFGVTSPR